MSINNLIKRVLKEPDSIEFDRVMETITANYRYKPTRFTNGSGENVVINEAGTNEGSCKIFAFARLAELNEEQTLACFGKYYRDDVLQHPDATDHANIRTFMTYGWNGIHFDGKALVRTYK